VGLIAGGKFGCRTASAASWRTTWRPWRSTYFAYNFIKIHRTLRVSQATAAGVTPRLFDVMDL
jgi:hypothetical protein